MKSICYIVLYFGKMPEMFQLWLDSCGRNPTIDWIIYTDDKTNYRYPLNVKVNYIEFKDMKEKIQKRFSFDLKINNPYRLCDYKVAFGYIFGDQLKEYDFWGYCDIDMIFGDIRKFITDEVLDVYDRIGFLGHSTLYRNTERVSTAFMTKIDEDPLYIKIFTNDSEQNSFFDEKWMKIICEKVGIRTYEETIFADIIPWAWKFRIGYVDGDEILKNEHRIFRVEKGKLFSYSIGANKTLIKDEYMYIHFLKRKMDINIDGETADYLIIPNRIIEYTGDVTKSLVKRYSINHMGLYWMDVLKRKWKKISIKNIYHYFRIRSLARNNYYNNK